MEGRQSFSHNLEDYLYDLPQDLVAQTATARRENCRLMAVDRYSGSIEHHRFDEVLTLLKPADVLVLNDTRVVPARLSGTKQTGGRVEILVLEPYQLPSDGNHEGYECLLKASKHPQAGSIIELGNGFQAKILTPPCEGRARVRFNSSVPILEILHRIGEIPLPPYIQRNGKRGEASDAAAYQTVYARNSGAIAAPTAGLHFSRPLLDQLASSGVEVVNITLHVGYGTFSPIRVKDIRNHSMHSEYVEISHKAATAIQKARKSGRRIVAVGTTVVRSLEWAALGTGEVRPLQGLCNHYIYPGYRFRVIDAMITNFHLPKSTLLLLVASFAGRKTILNAYRTAIEERYRFYSYGDAMFIS